MASLVSNVRLYAHRGAASESPENTLPSFALALELGADALEMDVHATLDGVLVVSHDPDGTRMAGVAMPFRAVPSAEVREWDAGTGFVARDGSRPFAGRGIRVPTLEEVVCAFPGVPLNVDLKAPVADAAVALLRRLGAEERVCLASFQASTLRRVRALGYAGPTSLASAEVAQLLALPAVLQRSFLRPRAARAQLPISLGRAIVVARCHALGLCVDYWTVNDAALARRLIALGADGIMTDDPRTIVPAVKAARAQTPSR
jgi:glycerophosphoryl diester phosphodiesterase